MKRYAGLWMLCLLVLAVIMPGCAPSIRWGEDVVEKHMSDAIHVDINKVAVALNGNDLFVMEGETLYKTNLEGAECFPVVDEVDDFRIAVQYATKEIIFWNRTKDASIRVFNMENGNIIVMNDFEDEMLRSFRGNPVVLGSYDYFCKLVGDSTFEVMRYDRVNQKYSMLSSFDHIGGLNYSVNMYTDGTVVYWLEHRDDDTFLAEYEPQKATTRYFSIEGRGIRNPYLSHGDLIFFQSRMQDESGKGPGDSMVIQRDFRNNAEQEVLVEFAPYSIFGSDPSSWNLTHGHDYESSGYYDPVHNRLYRISPKHPQCRLRFHPGQGAIVTIPGKGLYVFLTG